MVQKRYDKEFKSNDVELLLNSGKPLKPLARELGVTDTTLRAWRDAYVDEVEGYGDRCPGGQTPREMSDELRRLRKELDRVTRQREIPRKSLGHTLGSVARRYAMIERLENEHGTWNRRASRNDPLRARHVCAALSWSCYTKHTPLGYANTIGGTMRGFPNCSTPQWHS